MRPDKSPHNTGDPPLFQRLRARWLRWVIGVVVPLPLIAILALNISPWPGARLIRYVFDSDAAKVKEALLPFAPAGVSSITDQQYRAGDSDAMLDVYFSDRAAQENQRLPTLVWTHGGAWVSGSKTDAAPYYQLIAAEGYTVISLGYTLAPGKTYPTPIHQVNDALAYIQQNAERFHVDVDRILMGGSSAGAQIASQMATLITSSAYAAELRLTPALRPEQLRAVVLFSGIYDMVALLENSFLNPSRWLGWGTSASVWAYSGSRDRDTPRLRQMSSIRHVTADFPTAFISGGNDDPLTDTQSRLLAAKLKELGVDVTSLFYPEEHEPRLGHEHQFRLDNDDGQDTLRQLLDFLRNQT